MNRQEFIDAGILDELANVLDNRAAALALLEDIGYPRGDLPPFDTAANFWRQAIHEVASGRVAGGLDGLRQAAARRYRYNQIFNPPQQAAQPAAVAQAAARADAGTSIIATGGSDDVHQLIDQARAIWREIGGAGDVDLGFVSGENVQLHLPQARPEQAIELARIMDRRQLAARTTVIPGDFRDYLLHRIFVEGPDQGRFELSDIPASTRLKDVMRAVMNEYYGEIWPRDGSGRSRPAIVDLVNPETGAQQRLDPESSLHDNQVEDGATLHVAPESTAGGINPRIREEALSRVRAQIMAYAQEHVDFRVRANAKIAPTEYLFHFAAPGWGPPSLPGEQPYPVDRHEVLLLLPIDFPMKAPVAFWQGPIFHPNVHRQTGKVCLGVLEDRYRPGLDFGELCQILVDIAAYRNYEIREGYDSEAREWAISPAGQMAIEQRGGRSVTRLFLSIFDDQTREPLPMRIKRCDS